MTQTAATTDSKPEMLTVRQVAQRGILPETALRRLVKQGRIKSVSSGKTQYINYRLLLEQLNSGEGDVWQ